MTLFVSRLSLPPLSRPCPLPIAFLYIDIFFWQVWRRKAPYLSVNKHRTLMISPPPPNCWTNVNSRLSVYIRIHVSIRTHTPIKYMIACLCEYTHVRKTRVNRLSSDIWAVKFSRWCGAKGIGKWETSRKKFRNRSLHVRRVATVMHTIKKDDFRRNIKPPFVS